MKLAVNLREILILKTLVPRAVSIGREGGFFSVVCKYEHDDWLTDTWLYKRCALVAHNRLDLFNVNIVASGKGRAENHQMKGSNK